VQARERPVDAAEKRLRIADFDDGRQRPGLSAAGQLPSLSALSLHPYSSMLAIGVIGWIAMVGLAPYTTPAPAPSHNGCYFKYAVLGPAFVSPHAIHVSFPLCNSRG
jgi:hypothetical protein